MTSSILVVDDDPHVRASLSRALAADGTRVTAVESAEQALGLIGAAPPDVILSDVRMAGMDGLELLRLLRERAPGIDVVLMTAHDDLPLVATAMREGAVDFLLKPLELQRLRRAIGAVVEDRAARARAAEAAGADANVAPLLVGRDPRVVEIFKLVGQVARTRTSVVIRGESGTGKELIARAIHASSPYATEPFVAVNCTALTATLLESELFGHIRGAFTGATADRLGHFAKAGRGTLFLDEIGDTTPEFQGKLLRVLQEREFHPVGSDTPRVAEARVLAATHRDLETMVREGRFREDLYYRLRVIEIVVPPLRERLGDLPLIAAQLLKRIGAATDGPPAVLAREALDVLLSHRWPGNVRELENCLTRASILATGGVIRPDHLALEPPGSRVGAQQGSLEQVEREHIGHVLEASGWHKARAAEILGVSRPRLDRLLRKYGISRPGEEDSS